MKNRFSNWNDGFSLMELMAATAVASLSLILVASLVTTAVKSKTHVQSFGSVNDYAAIINETINSRLCDYAIRTPAGAKVAYGGAGPIDIRLEEDDPISGTSTVVLQPGPAPAGSQVSVQKLQLSELKAGVGQMTKTGLFYTFLGTMKAGTKTISNIQTLSGQNVPNVASAFSVVPGMRVMGGAIPNDPSNPAGIFGAKVTAVTPSTITISQAAISDVNGGALQVGDLYTVLNTIITLTTQDNSNSSTPFSAVNIPVILAVGQTSGTIDRCYGQDNTMLCAAMGGAIDPNGACSRTMFDQFTTLGSSPYSCSASSAGTRLCTVVPAGCSADYVVTGVTSNGGPLCQCVVSCPQ